MDKKTFSSVKEFAQDVLKNPSCNRATFYSRYYAYCERETWIARVTTDYEEELVRVCYSNGKDEGYIRFETAYDADKYVDGLMKCRQGQ